MEISWEFWWQVTLWMGVAAFCIAFIKSVDSGKKGGSN